MLGKQEPIVKNLGVIGCQVRHLPDFCQDKNVTSITMSALSCTYVDPWETLGIKGDKWTLLKDLSVHFIQTFLTLWAKGVMPECHGQNTMVCYENNKLKCFILRDHDTLRICTTAIEESGFTPPVYTIDTSTPNNLIFTQNEDLFNYFITLGIQINLYPIALATLKYTGRTESDFWEMVQDIIQDFVETQPISEQTKSQIQTYLLTIRLGRSNSYLRLYLRKKATQQACQVKSELRRIPIKAYLFLAMRPWISKSCAHLA